MASCCSRAISCYSYIHSSVKPAAACCAPNDACQFSQCHNRFVSAAVLHCVLGAVCVCSIHCAIYTGANTFQTGESFTLKWMALFFCCVCLLHPTLHSLPIPFVLLFNLFNVCYVTCHALHIDISMLQMDERSHTVTVGEKLLHKV